MRKPSRLGKGKEITKNKKSNISIAKKSNEGVFGSISISKRTDEYYRNFAKGTIENDILREQR